MDEEHREKVLKAVWERDHPNLQVNTKGGPPSALRPSPRAESPRSAKSTPRSNSPLGSASDAGARDVYKLPEHIAQIKA